MQPLLVINCYERYNALSSLRLFVSPFSSLPPALFHFKNSSAAASYSPRLCFIRRVEFCRSPSPTLKANDTSAPKRPVLRPLGHSLRTPASNLSKSLARIHGHHGRQRRITTRRMPKHHTQSSQPRCKRTPRHQRLPRHMRTHIHKHHRA